MVPQVVYNDYHDRTDVSLEASDELVADGAGVPEANERVEAARGDHIQSLRVVERCDAAVDPVVGVVLTRVERDDVADEQRLAVFAVLTTRDPRAQRRHESYLFRHHTSRVATGPGHGRAAGLESTA